MHREAQQRPVEAQELKFHIYNAESYDTIADSDAITFTAKKNN